MWQSSVQTSHMRFTLQGVFLTSLSKHTTLACLNNFNDRNAPDCLSQYDMSALVQREVRNSRKKDAAESMTVSCKVGNIE